MKNVIDDLVYLYNTIGSAIEYTVNAQINKRESVDYICPETYNYLLSASWYINELLKDADDKMDSVHDRFEEVKDIDLPFGEENTMAEDFMSSAMGEN